MNTPTQRQERAIKREAAMPEVKKLVKKYSRQTIQSCLNKLLDYDRKKRALNIAKREVEELEAELKD